MIVESWNKLKAQFLKQVEVENEYYPPKELKIQSTVDMGAGMTSLERSIHVCKELKNDWKNKKVSPNS